MLCLFMLVSNSFGSEQTMRDCYGELPLDVAMVSL